MAMLSRVRDRARGALRRGDLEEALSLAALIGRHFPDDIDTMELLGEMELARGHRPEARSILEATLAIDPERLLARSGLALIAEEDGDLDGALKQFEFAFALDTGNQQLAGEILRLHSRLNHTAPVDPEPSLYAMAWRQLREGRHDRAASLFQSGLRSDPESVEQAVGLAQALWLAGRFSAAEEVAGGVAASHPNCLKPLAILAGAAFSRGEGVAISVLRRTGQLNPGNGVARALFVAASLPFPRIGEEPEIPDEELIAAGVNRMPPPSMEDVGLLQGEPGEGGLEAEDRGSEADGRRFAPPETTSEGEWVRDRNRVPECWAAPATADRWRRLREDPASAPEVAAELLMTVESGSADPSLVWLAADALALSGRFRRAVQLYRRIAEDLRGIQEA